MNDKTGFTQCLTAFFLAIIIAFPANNPVQAETVAVNTTDDRDNGSCDAAHCSLREAINRANLNPGADRITFNFPSGTNRIYLQTDLPPITDNGTIIEGLTVLATRRTNIVLDGSLGEIDAGLRIESNNNIIRNLSMVGFSEIALVVRGDSNLLESNSIGITPDGDRIANGWGIYIGGTNVTIHNNTISGNEYGIYTGFANRATIQGNRIGTDRLGLVAIGNQRGIYLSNCEAVVIGGNGEREGNIISGNEIGIYIDRATRNSRIKKNKIGTDFSGTRAIANQVGISILDADMITIGGEETGDGNVIAGNTHGGIEIATSGRVFILGNDIGKPGLPNRIGIDIQRSPEGYIGPNNHITNNLSDGILISYGEHLNIVRNNIMSNGGHGIHVLDSGGNDRITIQQNRIGYNSGKGIHFNKPAINNGIQPPTIVGWLPFYLTVNTCPNCLVEVFLSDIDPSGSGEGYFYLQSYDAPASGLVSIRLEGISMCSLVTTTETDRDGNTSEFSNNWMIGLCHTPAWLTISLLVISLITLTGTGTMIWQKPGSPIRGIFAIFTALATIGLWAGVLWLNFGDLPQRKLESVDKPYPPLSNRTCTSVLDPQKVSPPDGAEFTTGQTPEFHWGIQDGLNLPANSRWLVEMIDPNGIIKSQSTSSTEISLAAFADDTLQEGDFYWRLTLEKLNPTTNQWEIQCQDDIYRYFIFRSEMQVIGQEESTEKAEQEISTETPIQTQANQDEPPTALARINLNCRMGPNELYDLIDGLRTGEIAPIIGRNEDNSWWKIQPPRAVMNCWVLASGVDARGDLGRIPFVASSELPEIPQEASTADDSEQQPPAQNEQTGCLVFNPNLQKNLCIAPCPVNATSLGSCTP